MCLNHPVTAVKRQLLADFGGASAKVPSSLGGKTAELHHLQKGKGTWCPFWCFGTTMSIIPDCRPCCLGWWELESPKMRRATDSPPACYSINSYYHQGTIGHNAIGLRFNADCGSRLCLCEAHSFPQIITGAVVYPSQSYDSQLPLTNCRKECASKCILSWSLKKEMKREMKTRQGSLSAALGEAWGG